MNQEGRRVAVLLVPARLILEMLKPGRVCWIDGNPLPETARIVGDKFDIVRGVWRFLVEDQSFDPIDEGVEPPELPWMSVHVETRPELAP